MTLKTGPSITTRRERFPIKKSFASAPANRRDLLKGLSLAGLAAGSTTALGALPAEAAPAQQAADPRTLQYRETDHVRTFYQLARK